MKISNKTNNEAIGGMMNNKTPARNPSTTAGSLRTPSPRREGAGGRVNPGKKHKTHFTPRLPISETPKGIKK